jgi:hypothetical protein
MRALSLLPLLTLLTACSAGQTKLSDEAKELQLFPNKPGSECAVVGKVVGENGQGSVDLARNHARNLAAKLGANGMFIDQEVPNGAKMRVFATAYQCE